ALAVRAGAVAWDGLDDHGGGSVGRRDRGLLGRRHDAHARHARVGTHPGPRRLPGVVPADAGLRSRVALVGREELVLRETDRLLDIEAERRRIPPDDAVLPQLGAMQPGPDR